MQIMNSGATMAALSELRKNDTTLGKELKKVASGMKVNDAGDGASEYAMSEKMRVRLRSLDQDIENAQTGRSLVKRMTERNDLPITGTTAETRPTGTASFTRSSALYTITSSGVFHIPKETPSYYYINIAADNVELVADEDVVANIRCMQPNGKVWLNNISFVNQHDGNAISCMADTKLLLLGHNTITTPPYSYTRTVSCIQGINNSHITIENGSSASEGTLYIEAAQISKDTPSCKIHRRQSLIIHTGTKSNQHLRLYIDDMHTKAMGLDSATIVTREDAHAALDVLDNAVNYALNENTRMGAYAQRLDYTVRNLTTSRKNTQSSESTIRDADMAKEMTAEG